MHVHGHVCTRECRCPWRLEALDSLGFSGFRVTGSGELINAGAEDQTQLRSSERAELVATEPGLQLLLAGF